MEDYSCTNNSAYAMDTYETPGPRGQNPEQKNTLKAAKSVKTSNFCYSGSLIIAFLSFCFAVLALIGAAIAITFTQIELKTVSNDADKETNDSLQRQLNASNMELQQLRLQVNNIQSFLAAPKSCQDAQLRDSPSGFYAIKSSFETEVHVYCDMDRTSCSCNAAKRWMRVANLDMTDPNQTCPNEFKLVDRTQPPLRLCGRPGPAGCCPLCT